MTDTDNTGVAWDGEGTEHVVLTVERHNELVRASRKLAALEAGGVDNWEGYSESLSEFYDEEGDD